MSAFPLTSIRIGRRRTIHTVFFVCETAVTHPSEFYYCDVHRLSTDLPFFFVVVVTSFSSSMRIQENTLELDSLDNNHFQGRPYVV